MILLIFCIVLFFYLHIYFQLKTSNDLEVYDIYQPSKDKLEEICDLRQPVIFQFDNNSFIDSCNRKMVSESYSAFDVNIRNIKNECKQQEQENGHGEIYKSIELKKALILIEKDVEEKLFIENNHDFLDETGLIKQYKNNDSFLRPFMVSECKYDFLTGSKGTCTPFRYDLNYRNYYLVTDGSVRVKIAPPKNTKYLYSIEDYYNFEFRSPINCWNVQPQYSQEFEKVKCMEFTMNKGQIVFIPAYWWVSFRFETPVASICSFKYKTIMNTVSILPKIFLRFLHHQNHIKIALEQGFKKITNTGNHNTNNTITTTVDNVNDNDILVKEDVVVKNDTIIKDIKINDLSCDKNTNIIESDSTPII